MQRTEGPWGSRGGARPSQPEELQLPFSQSALAAGPSSPEACPWGHGDTLSFPGETCPPHGGISRLQDIPQLVQGHPVCVWGRQDQGPRTWCPWTSGCSAGSPPVNRLGGEMSDGSQEP